MKSNPVLLLLAAFLFSLGSCTKELSRENPVQQAQGPGNFYATIDGQIWEADSVQVAIVDDSGIVTITGISKSQEEISMVLDVSVGRQTYIEDCEVCCKPIEISFTIEDDDLASFHAKTLA